MEPYKIFVLDQYRKITLMIEETYHIIDSLSNEELQENIYGILSRNDEDFKLSVMEASFHSDVLFTPDPKRDLRGMLSDIVPELYFDLDNLLERLKYNHKVNKYILDTSDLTQYILWDNVIEESFFVDLELSFGKIYWDVSLVKDEVKYILKNILESIPTSEWLLKQLKETLSSYTPEEICMTDGLPCYHYKIKTFSLYVPCSEEDINKEEKTIKHCAKNKEDTEINQTIFKNFFYENLITNTEFNIIKEICKLKICT